jgi:hypothetical protein
MDERESFDARQEAKREAAGKVDRSTRQRMWDGLTKYLAAEAQHTRKASASEKKDRDRRSP